MRSSTILTVIATSLLSISQNVHANSEGKELCVPTDLQR